MGSLLNLERLYVYTIHPHAGGPFFCATRFEQKALYRHLGMKLLWQLSSKKDPAFCGNYKPVSLLAVGYKIFAAILLRRLNDAGAEGQIWPTQFGFRCGCGCADAVFVARRNLKNAWAQKNGNLLLLALDWAKMFDSISLAGLVNAMSRSGIPYHFRLVVRGIHNRGHFMVRDEGVTSRQHPQFL